MPSSEELLEMAHTEWKNREERRKLHDEVSWESGWISGYLSRPHTSPPARTVEHMQSAYAHGRMDGAKAEREQVLDEVREKLSHIRFQEEDMWFIEATIKEIESLRGGGAP